MASVNSISPFSSIHQPQQGWMDRNCDKVIGLSSVVAKVALSVFCYLGLETFLPSMGLRAVVMSPAFAASLHQLFSIFFPSDKILAFKATEEGDVKTLKQILDKGKEAVDVNAKDGAGIPLLHWAVLKNQKDVVALLLKRGADVNAQDEASQSTFISSQLGILGTFIAWMHFGKEASEKFHNTALHHAASNGNRKMVELLLAKGTNLTAKNNRNFQPIHCAAINSHAGVVKLLMEKLSEGEDRDLALKESIVEAAYYVRRGSHQRALDGEKNDVPKLLEVIKLIFQKMEKGAENYKKLGSGQEAAPLAGESPVVCSEEEQEQVNKIIAELKKLELDQGFAEQVKTQRDVEQFYRSYQQLIETNSESRYLQLFLLSQMPEDQREGQWWKQQWQNVSNRLIFKPVP